MNTDANGKTAELKERLREALNSKRMKPIELSEITGIPKSMISYYLSGKSVPKADRIYKIARALDINEAWLMGFDVPKERTVGQKKNDDLARAIAMVRKDPELIDFISKILQLSPEQFSSVNTIVSALVDKQLEDQV